MEEHKTDEDSSEDYSKFHNFIYLLGRKEKDVETSSLISGNVESEKCDANPQEIRTRLDVVSNKEVEKIVYLILKLSDPHYGLLKKEIKGAIAGYENLIRDALEDWQVNDFEILQFVLFGQKEESE